MNREKGTADCPPCLPLDNVSKLQTVIGKRIAETVKVLALSSLH
jgi:hypothetical protein